MRRTVTRGGNPAVKDGNDKNDEDDMMDTMDVMGVLPNGRT